MPSVNKVFLMGHVGQDPVVKTTQSGEIMANVSLATSEKYKDKVTGETREQTEWHRLIFFGKLAEIVQQYVTKGRAIFIEGKIRTRKWTDNNNIERYTTEILCNSVQLLGNKDSAQGQTLPPDTRQQQNTVNAYAKAQAKGNYYDYDGRPVRADDLIDDMPF